jgi:mycothiol synthase
VTSDRSLPTSLTTSPAVRIRDADPRDVLAFLGALEAVSGVPPVDEDEQRRLAGLPPVRDPGWTWSGHLVDLGSAPVAYAGVRMPPAGAQSEWAARVDLALDRDRPGAEDALVVALTHLREHAGARSAGVEAWLRGAGEQELAVAARAGFRERSRLHVLGASTAAIARAASERSEAIEAPAGTRLRAFDPGSTADADAVVRLLTRAYPELAGWYAEGFAVLRASAWFRADDLLLLESTGSPGSTGSLDAPAALLALHWMKRRGDDVGEVYNLAVDPDAQGRGFGPLLLDAGLDHLLATGSREVVLWVDATNERALALYRSRGFTLRWDDVSLVG